MQDETRKMTSRSALMKSPERFNNRELSWLAFNWRVMEEAHNKEHPLFERLRFLSISGNNLDEFTMVRIAGIKGQLKAKVATLSDDGLIPDEQLEAINQNVRQLIAEQARYFEVLKEEMAEAGIFVVEADGLNRFDLRWLETRFLKHIFPVLTPLAMDPAHPIPFIPNCGRAMVLKLTQKGKKVAHHALVPLPPQLDRFIRLPSDKARFIALEDVISLFLDQLFPGFEAESCGMFRLLRDSFLSVDEGAEDLMSTFEVALKKRRRGHVIRLTLSAGMPQDVIDILKEEFHLGDDDIFPVDGFIGITDLSDLISSDFPDLLFKSYTPRFPERVRDFGGDCFAAITHKDFVVHHPYESFDVVVQFLRQAANDPDVVAIKQTLYRTSQDSPIVHALIEAAEAGKSVTAMVELRARFDEAANIRWARDMERAGVQVVYGFLEFKTHAKVTLVVRREGSELKSYVHYGTGNYHPITAKIYTDLSFFTADPALGRDAQRAFNYMTGYALPSDMEKLTVAPLYLRDKILGLIKDEIAHVKAGRPGAIWAKCNSLVDDKIIDALYEASQAGVQIDLIIRGICCLRPGVKGLSENIRVKSIVGRFLEHSRIVCFGNGKKLPSRKAKVFISSADWMRRNTMRRMEVLVPIENETVHQQIMDQIMLSNLKDNKQSWILKPDGSYDRVRVEKGGFSCHKYCMTNPSLSGRGSAVKKGKRAMTLSDL